ncbi:type IV pilus modification protein PilV [Luteimonas sp. SJ-92]|uniref:Type IV pilus modification protein PilV n=1 Tax=Luteimonas salinisoli TaxID=2752307 RepID=A0A853JCI5_9GAMM|nr:type IV pilus modification protein PilV [Luteimonas salinisoli]NZA26300.1 type IV pilus modification protein PilV [Luteimonas salinisoli]
MHLNVIRRGGSGARNGQAGFSMIEVMVALLILALGLLGFALLQTLNLRYTQSADYRTRATNLAYELLDQMRVNSLSAAEFPSASFDPGEVDDPPPGGCPRVTADRMPVVSDDGVIARWQCQVVHALGEHASAVVAYDAASGLASVQITWGERFTADPQTTFEVETFL